MQSLGKHVEEMIHLKLLRGWKQKRPYGTASSPSLARMRTGEVGHWNSSTFRPHTSHVSQVHADLTSPSLSEWIPEKLYLSQWHTGIFFTFPQPQTVTVGEVVQKLLLTLAYFVCHNGRVPTSTLTARKEWCSRSHVFPPSLPERGELWAGILTHHLDCCGQMVLLARCPLPRLKI